MAFPTQHKLEGAAWLAYESSRPRSGTKVGCAVLDDGGGIHCGTNVELEFRLGMHAELGALSAMAARNPGAKAIQIVIASQRSRFTPCGGCMDWIMQLATPGCVIQSVNAKGIAFEGKPSALMPWYPQSGGGLQERS